MAIGTVSHDRQQPGASFDAAQAVESAPGPQHGLLHDILRVSGIANQPTGEIVGGGQVRQHQPCKRARVEPGHIAIDSLRRL